MSIYRNFFVLIIDTNLTKIDVFNIKAMGESQNLKFKK